MLIQDAITVGVLFFFVVGSIIFGIPAYTDFLTRFEASLVRKNGVEIHWGQLYNSYKQLDNVYATYGVCEPKREIKSVFRKQKYIKKQLLKILASFNTNMSLSDFTEAFLKVNDSFIHNDFRLLQYYPTPYNTGKGKEMLTASDVVFFVDGEYDLEKVRELYRRGFSFDDIVKLYDMPLEWVDSMYGVTPLVRPLPVSRF